MPKWGFVYCLSNESMPGIYKIGMTNGPPSIRAAQLSASSGCAEPFALAMYMEVPNPSEYEKSLHQMLAKDRASERREFFRCRLDKIYAAFEYLSDLQYSIALSHIAAGDMVSADYLEGKREYDFGSFRMKSWSSVSEECEF